MASNPNESTRHQVALAVAQSYSEWSMDSIMAYRAPNCIHQILPLSLSRPPMTNAAYRAYLSSIIPMFCNFKVTVHDLIEDSQANKVVMWASSTADTELGPHANEYMTVLYFNAESKVEKILEFVNSAYTVAFFGRLRQLRAEKENEKEKETGNQTTHENRIGRLCHNGNSKL